jgi:transcription elongation GreA/GreB family factor
MDKTFLVEQLGSKIREQAQTTLRAAADAGVEAKTGAARAVNLARGTSQRTEAARASLDALDAFRVRAFKRGEALGLGAVVEIEDGEAGRTLFLAPVGAGEELSGPGGDGVFQVVTPVSPIGKAIVGKKVGDVVEVMVKGELSEWTITWAA